MGNITLDNGEHPDLSMIIPALGIYYTVWMRTRGTNFVESSIRSLEYQRAGKRFQFPPYVS